MSQETRRRPGRTALKKAAQLAAGKEATAVAELTYTQCGGYLQGSSSYGHVGIYVGDGYVIHARATVRKDSLSNMLSSGYKYMGWGWQGGVDQR